MIEIRQTAEYSSWFSALQDRRAKARIDVRIRRMSLRNVGDAESVGEGVLELRLHYGPGYRIYYTRRGNCLVILLAGGIKSTQSEDIKMAKSLARKIGADHGEC